MTKDKKNRAAGAEKIIPFDPFSSVSSVSYDSTLRAVAIRQQPETF
jgi:hypothetical protein